MLSMKKNMRLLDKILIGLFVFINTYGAAYAYTELHPENSAYRHNNKGLIYIKENNYYAAAAEFQTAIDLMPNAQGTAAYYVNLASVYEKLGYDEEVKICLERALKLNPLYFDYYKRAAEWYKKAGILNSKIKEYENNRRSPLDDVMLGLLYIQKGEISKGVTILDNFCCAEEQLIITEGVRGYINSLVMQD